MHPDEWTCGQFLAYISQKLELRCTYQNRINVNKPTKGIISSVTKNRNKPMEGMISSVTKNRNKPIEGMISHPVLPPKTQSSHTNHGEDTTLSFLVERV